MVDKTELAALVERVLGGDTRAYETIYLETKDNIYFHAKTVLKSDESAWDAVQDTFVAASSSFKTGFVTETLWSYHLPFVPMMATSNSSSSAGTGISKPLTSSLRPSE